MRVVIVGAGIGGLTLAQALVARGIEVSVHDRDADLSATGGYRLHLDRHACAALRRHLPPALHQALLASSAGAQNNRRFAFADHRLRVLAEEPRDPEQETLLVGRIPLRRLLAHGLGDGVAFASEFTHYTTDDDGTVTAHFADGRAERADLLVGADGVGSRVGAALAGRPTSRPTGMGGIAGRTRLTAELRALLPPLLQVGPALALDATGVSLFAHVHDPQAGTLIDPATCVAVGAEVEPADVVWGVQADERRLPPEVRRLAPAAVQRAAADLLGGWHPAARAIVTAPAHAVGAFRFHAADPDADLTPWPSGVVTVLGDAVHAMPPTGGRAAATAIRDADLLARELDAVLAGEATVPLAVHAYERGMPAYAADAVRVSLAPLAWQRRLARPVPRRLARVALPALAAAHRLRRTTRAA